VNIYIAHYHSKEISSALKKSLVNAVFKCAVIEPDGF